MKIPDNAVTDSILLRGKVISVLSCELPQQELLFYPENPRIYSSVRADGDDDPSQEEIFQVLSKTEHVRETLVPSIRNNGGLIEPILVRGSTVLEGNSRLASYRILSHSEPGKWRLIRAKVLPKNITDSQVFSLLGEYHMVGKKDWLPYEQAGYLFRRHEHHEVAVDELVGEVGLTRRKVEHLISVYRFMLDHNERSRDKWSFYDELLKKTSFKELLTLYPRFYEIITDKIKAREIERAVDLRDQLPHIVRAGGNTLKKFLQGKTSFDEAIEDARLRGAGNYHARKLKSVQQWLAEPDIETELEAMSNEEINNVRYLFDKIKTRIKQLLARTAKH
jgi:hypothetical protein